MNKSEAIDKMVHQCSDFMFQNNLPSLHINKLVSEAIEAKEPILNKLELYPENEYRTSIPIPITKETKPHIWSFVNKVCELIMINNKNNLNLKGTVFTPIDMMFVADNKKNKYRITKLIPNVWDVILRDFIFRDMLNCENSTYQYGQNDLNKFLIWYGDIISSDRKIIISGNTFDMLTASSNASFTSCYSPEGGYFNGTIANSLSPHILIAYIQSDYNHGHKIGRCWIYANESAICPARKYGFITIEHSLHIRNYISSRLGGDWTLRDGGIRKQHILQLGPGYLDDGAGELIVNKNCGLMPFNVPMAICLFCGMRHSDCSKTGCCNDCSNLLKPPKRI